MSSVFQALGEGLISLVMSALRQICLLYTSFLFFPRRPLFAGALVLRASTPKAQRASSQKAARRVGRPAG